MAKKPVVRKGQALRAHGQTKQEPFLQSAAEGAGYVANQAGQAVRNAAGAVGREFDRDVRAGREMSEAARRILGGDADSGVEKFNP